MFLYYVKWMLEVLVINSYCKYFIMSFEFILIFQINFKSLTNIILIKYWVLTQLIGYNTKLFKNN